MRGVIDIVYIFGCIVMYIYFSVLTVYVCLFASVTCDELELVTIISYRIKKILRILLIIIFIF